MISLAALLLVAVTVPAIAWEFSMKGEWEYRMRYFSRTGGTDLFGIADLQNNGFTEASGIRTGFVGFAGPNWYNRGALPAMATDSSYQLVAGPGYSRITRGGFSRTESDAFWTDSRLTFYPEIRVNQAIRVHGVYNVGGYTNKYAQSADATGMVGAVTGLGGIQTVGVPPFSRYYMSQMSGNAYDTAAVGSWEQFRATIQMPWGIWSLGVKDFPFGVGATLGNNTRAEAFLTVVPYGPFRFMHGIWLSRGVFGSQATPATVVLAGLPENLNQGQESWGTSPDSQSRNTLFQGGLFTYDSGSLSMGGGFIWRQLHVGRNEMANIALNTGRFGNNGFDMNTQIALVFGKYNNGRFFTNIEYAFMQNDIYALGSQNPFLAAAVGPRFDEAYHWFCEAGVMAGPAKVSLLWAIASGDVLNLATNTTGILYGNQTKNYRGWAMNYQAMEAYQFLMFETYAGGNNGGWRLNDVTFVSDDHGMMTDAFCFAGRADYSVASNLNVFGSYIWAHRLEKAGTFAGGYASTGGTGSTTALAAQVWKGTALGVPSAGLNPYPDDGFIGWEVNLGIGWKLLEGLTFNAKYSYWKPGEWFDQAYRNVGMVGGAPSPAALVTGKSPIMGMTGSLMIDF